ncbi:kinase-like domain-containing protein [Trichoderma chlorosporum]
MPLFDVQGLSELVRSKQLETKFRFSDHGNRTITVHKFTKSPSSKRYEESWSRQKHLGRGGYGQVWQEERMSGDGPRLRAVKMIILGSSLDMSRYARELEAIAKFSKSRYAALFPTFYGWYQTNDHLCIAMEYLPLGDLKPYVQKSQPLDEQDIVSITQQVVKALKFMHSESFAHRDLKPANIMLASHLGSQWKIKLIDFGNSKILEKTQTTAGICGTEGYIAPDLMIAALDHQQSSSGNRINISPSAWLAGDIWSLGEIIFQLFVKRVSFSSRDDLLEYYIGKKDFPIQKLLSMGISSEAMDFIQQAMKAPPSSRMTIEAAAAHTWLRTPDPLASPEHISISTARYVKIIVFACLNNC